MPQTTSLQRFKFWGRSAFITILVLAAALLLYVGFTICRANFHAVLPGLVYRAGQMSEPQLGRIIQTYGIKSVVNLRGKSNSGWYRDEVAVAEKLGVQHYDFALSANQEVSVQRMDEIIETLRRAPKPVLIHCKAGADRSGLVSALYCLVIDGEKPATADRELSVWYGHIPLAGTIAMDDSFWHYVGQRNASAEFKPQPVSP